MCDCGMRNEKPDGAHIVCFLNKLSCRLCLRDGYEPSPADLRHTLRLVVVAMFYSTRHCAEINKKLTRSKAVNVYRKKTCKF